MENIEISLESLAVEMIPSAGLPEEFLHTWDMLLIMVCYLFFYFLSIYLFIYGCVGTSFLCEGFL